MNLDEVKLQTSLRSKWCVFICVAGNVVLVLLPSLTFVRNTIDNRIIIMINIHRHKTCKQKERIYETNKKKQQSDDEARESMNGHTRLYRDLRSYFSAG